MPNHQGGWVRRSRSSELAPSVPIGGEVEGVVIWRTFGGRVEVEGVGLNVVEVLYKIRSDESIQLGLMKQAHQTGVAIPPSSRS